MFKKIIKIFFIFIYTLMVIISALYLLTVFGNIKPLNTLRDLWIETAMTTGEHQWLATQFYSEEIINSVMSKKVEDEHNIIGITQITSNIPESVNTDKVKPEVTDKEDIQEIEIEEETTDTLKVVITGDDKEEEELPVEEETEETEQEVTVNDIEVSENHEVIVDDKEQGIKILKIKTLSFTGYLAFIDDPMRVFVEDTSYPGKQGETITDYLEKHDAILGINANAFMDNGGVGRGGDILGYSISYGKVWGRGNFADNTTMAFNSNGQLLVGKIDDYSNYDLQHGGQFGPTLIRNGEILVSGTAGWGLQPRSIIGQRDDGVVVFLVIDGRQPGYSIGATMGDAAELLHSYGVVNAAACDGGSSAVMAYDGELINSPSTPMTYGRYLPNAFLVKKK